MLGTYILYWTYTANNLSDLPIFIPPKWKFKLLRSNADGVFSQELRK